MYGLSMDTIRNWRKAFESHRLESFVVITPKRVRKPALPRLTLQPNERAEWNALLANGGLSASQRRRLRCLLYLDEGKTVAETAALLEISQGLAYAIRRRFVENRENPLGQPPHREIRTRPERWENGRQQHRGSQLRPIEEVELAELQRLAQDEEVPVATRERAQLILDLNDGWKAVALAKRRNVTRQAISDKVSSFNLRGLDWVHGKKGRTVKPV